MNPDNPLAEHIRKIAQHLADKPWGSVSSLSFGDWGVNMLTYGTSEEGLEYVNISFQLPPDVYAVGEGNSYGEIYALRIFEIDLPHPTLKKGAQILPFTASKVV
jgi:hypothetical protein